MAYNIDMECVESYEDTKSIDIDEFKVLIYLIKPYRALTIEHGTSIANVDEKSKCVTISNKFTVGDKEISYEITRSATQITDILVTVIYKNTLSSTHARITYELSNINAYRSEMDSVILDCVKHSAEFKLSENPDIITWINEQDPIYKELYDLFL